MAFLLDDTTLKVENYIIVIEFYKLEFVKLIKVLFHSHTHVIQNHHQILHRKHHQPLQTHF